MQESLSTDALILTAFNEGQLMVYPTEAVMGIGCDPDNEAAFMRLLDLKSRPIEKGVILVADSYSRLLPYVDDAAIRQDRRTQIISSWPGPVTWLLPKSASAPGWITGQHTKIAVRVSNHPVVRHLCQVLGKPLVSTSANPSGCEPARTADQARKYFGQDMVYVEGEVGGSQSPSKIFDGDTGEVVRS